MTKFLALFTIFFCLTFEALAQDKGVLSFMYHRIDENKPSLVSTNVKLEMFQEHIKLLEESKYGFISAQQFKDYVLKVKDLILSQSNKLLYPTNFSKIQ